MFYNIRTMPENFADITLTDASSTNPNAVEKDIQYAEATNTVSTTSLTSVDLPNMTLTTSSTVDKKYLCIFNAQISLDNTEIATFELLVNGTIESTRSFESLGNNNEPSNMTVQFLTPDTTTGIVIKVQYRVSGGATVIATNRSLSILGI